MKAHDSNESPRKNSQVAEASMTGPTRDPRAGSGAAGVPRPRTAPAPGQRPRFEVVLRGYDRTAVDAYLDGHAGEWQSLRHELDNSERRRQQAEQHAAATERENRTLRTEHPPAAATPEDGFGFRVEKLMRMAEQEVADVRAGAARDASALLEQARAQAEHHRHDIEQSLITRSGVLDQQAARRSAELQEREQQIGEQLAAARAEAQALREAAEFGAEQRRAQAEADAVAVRDRATQEARRVLDQARQEADRLVVVQGGARADLARIADLLATELGGPRRGGDTRGGEARSGEARSGAHRGDGPATPSDGPVDRSPVTAATGR